MSINSTWSKAEYDAYFKAFRKLVKTIKEKNRPKKFTCTTKIGNLSFCFSSLFCQYHKSFKISTGINILHFLSNLSIFDKNVWYF